MRTLLVLLVSFSTTGCLKPAHPSVVPKSEARMKCTQCKWTKDADDMCMTCVACGCEVIAEKATTKCPKCSAILHAEESWMICAQCGKDVLNGGFMVGLMTERTSVTCAGCSKALTPADMVTTCACGEKVPGTGMMSCPKCAGQMKHNQVCEKCTLARRS
jgi:hypothetical protein